MAFPNAEQGPKQTVVIGNPTDDEEFVALAERLVADGAVSPDDLQRQLAPRYPHVLVRERVLTGEPVRVWYAYRDGHWVDSRDDRAL